MSETKIKKQQQRHFDLHSLKLEMTVTVGMQTKFTLCQKGDNIQARILAQYLQCEKHGRGSQEIEQHVVKDIKE